MTWSCRWYGGFATVRSRLPDGLHWDVLGLYVDVLEGCATQPGEWATSKSVAVDSWAVDYGLLDAHGALLGNPFHYRDARTTSAVEHVHRRVDPVALYQVNGLQHLPFNTTYQLASEGTRLHDAASALLIPDLIGYWLSGVNVAEQTNASTTGLLDARTGRWADDLLESAGLPPRQFPDLVLPGTEIGGLSRAVRDATGLSNTVRLSVVGSHDTASAVVGVPAVNDRFAYISCGTSGLVGVELAEPVLSEASRHANFTIERGVDGTVRYLRNVMGLWLLQESLRTWRLAGLEQDLPVLLAAAGELPAAASECLRHRSRLSDAFSTAWPLHSPKLFVRQRRCPGTLSRLCILSGEARRTSCFVS